MPTFDYDIIVLGGGGGGLTAAKTARGFGKRVAIIEKKDHLGGECTWTGCVPSKTLIKTAQIAYNAKNIDIFGLKSHTPIQLDTSNVMDHIRKVIRTVYKTHEPPIIEKLGIDVLFGSYSFINTHTVQSGNKKLSAKQFIIATGSSPFVPPIEGLSSVNYLTNETLFDLKELPQSMIILCGGPIGIEIASALNRLGVTITIIEMQERILPKEDTELITLLSGMLHKEGVQLLTGMRATKVTQHNDTITVSCIDSNGSQKDIPAQSLLVAVGRKPNIEDLALEKIGIKTTKRGIITDTMLRTTVKNIFACGDVVGPYQFSHMAWYQAVIAVKNAVIPFFKQRVDYTHRIWVTFTAPELATAGLTENQAREKFGDTIKIYRKSYAEIDRGLTDIAGNGMVKIICDKKGYLLGMHILGERAGDIIHELQVAKVKGIKFYSLHAVIHAYPSYAELLWHTAKKAYVQRLYANPLLKLLKKIFITDAPKTKR